MRIELDKGSVMQDMKITKACKIAYIEDDKIVIMMVSKSLSRHYETVLNADDGEKGLALVIKEKPDVIITDLEMPGINGMEMITLLREKYNIMTPVIVTTGNTSIDDPHGYVSHLISKPINIKTLATLIELLV